MGPPQPPSTSLSRSRVGGNGTSAATAGYSGGFSGGGNGYSLTSASPLAKILASPLMPQRARKMVDTSALGMKYGIPGMDTTGMMKEEAGITSKI